MNTKSKPVGTHRQRKYRHKVGYRQNYEQGNLSELVGKACDFFFLRRGMRPDLPFNAYDGGPRK